MRKIVVLLTLLAMAAPVVAQQGVNDPSIYGDPDEAAKGGDGSTNDAERGIALFILVLIVAGAAFHRMNDNYRSSHQRLESQLSRAEETIHKLCAENQQLRENLAIYTGEQLALPLQTIMQPPSNENDFEVW